jgi:tetratricopeptide (TPR) repeat protein
MKLPSIKIPAIFIAAGMLWTVGVLCFVQARPLLDFNEDFSPRDFSEFHGSVVGSLLGQIRISVGDILWLKSDEYLHSGVRHRRRTQKERDEDLRTGHDHGPEDHHAHHHHADHGDEGFEELHCDHEDLVTVIPSEERDIRGLFGALDRQVHPFTLHPSHSNPGELAPWYRLLTYVNPNHIRGYIVGAYVISAHGGQEETALEFLLEGERNNPLSIEIKEALGRFHFLTRGDTETAIPYFEQAIAIAQQKTQLNSSEEFALRNTYRNRVLLYWRGKNDLATSKKILLQGLKRFPDDKALRRLGRQMMEESS